jgi:signal-transduction protein with cAMP-binding, CBS, and nucleotidyltransferase domain
LQESAIFLSKVLLPQIFEKLTGQDLRALIAEKSEMTVYIRGETIETIEIPNHSVAFLLEGNIKTQGRQELVTAPAALLPSHGNRSFQNLSMSGIITCLIYDSLSNTFLAF